MTRAALEAAFRAAVAACDPAALVEAAGVRADRALAIGKAALAMARGAGAVADGLCVVPFGGAGALPAGWALLEAAHPVPDERSVAAGAAAVALVERARTGETLLALISGGASALVEQPRGALADLVAQVRAAQAGGAPIAEVNALRTRLSLVKGGQLARRCAGRVVTLAVSDVIGDDLAVIGSGPTVAPERLPPHGRDEARVLAPMISAARAAAAHLRAPLREAPLADDVARVAAVLAAERGPLVAWGEPTVRLPASPGEGGRAQQLALHLARAFRGTARAALVAGTDGVDGPAPGAPAGAFVDGASWDAIAAAGLDPAAALARCDARPALAAIGALLATGPTGINHADLVLLA